MKHIAIIGECMIELNGKPFGEMLQTYGGDTLNAAVYLRRSCEANANPQAVNVSYVTALGQDPISEGMLSRWQEEGITTDLVLRDPHRTPGLYLIQLDENGERTFLYWRNQSAARHMLQHADFSRIAEALAQVDMVFLSGITLAILSDEDRQALLALLATLKAKGVEIAFDSNFRPALWPNDGHQTIKAAYDAMLNLTDLALVTFDDEQLLWQDESPTQTLARLAQHGISKRVVKLGKDGCLVQNAEAETETDAEHIRTTPVDNVVDTTSAGDSFNGGFLSAYLAGESLQASCERGNALAGVVIQHRGAIIPKSVTQAALLGI